MRIEIRRVGFKNKGSELMLRAIISNIKNKLPDADLVLAPNLGTAPYIDRAYLGLYQKIWLYRYNIQWGKFGKLIPRKLREMFGMILDSEIDVILDAAGFLYSDQWDAVGTIETAKAIKNWRKRGTKIVFMPQAFGPFRNLKIRNAMKTIITNADIIYARDKISLNHLHEIYPNTNNIKLAPDFTTTVDGQLPDNFDFQSNRFCIIPNYKMVSMNSNERNTKYINGIAHCIRYLDRKGEKPFILIHDEIEDPLLAKIIMNSAGININLIHEKDPLKIKGIIGYSKGVISSRFHGLVSALSQGVPALASSWSHKYEMLCTDYGISDAILDLNADHEDVNNKIDKLLSDYDDIKNILNVNAKKHREATNKMWEEIYALITHP